MHARGLMVAAASGVCFSISTVVAQSAISAGMSALGVAAVRLCIGAAALMSLGLWRGLADLTISRRALLAATGLFTAAQATLLFASVQRVGSSLAILLLYLYAPMVAVIAAATGRERITRRKVAALVSAAAGLVLVIWSPGGEVDALGLLLGVASGTALALYITVADRTTRAAPPLTSTAWVQVGAAVGAVPLVLAVDGPSGLLRNVPWWVVFVGLASGAAALLFIFAIQHVTPTLASIASTVEPVSTAVLAVIFLGDRLTLTQVCGGVLILAAVVVISQPDRTEAVEPDLAAARSAAP
jgi:drug/metabolite transporter (DMT)-like permease